MLEPQLRSSNSRNAIVIQLCLLHQNTLGWDFLAQVLLFGLYRERCKTKRKTNEAPSEVQDRVVHLIEGGLRGDRPIGRHYRCATMSRNQR